MVIERRRIGYKSAIESGKIQMGSTSTQTEHARIVSDLFNIKIEPENPRKYRNIDSEKNLVSSSNQTEDLHHLEFHFDNSLKKSKKKLSTATQTLPGDFATSNQGGWIRSHYIIVKEMESKFKLKPYELEQLNFESIKQMPQYFRNIAIESPNNL